jgi:tRNA nucleotidyltransferase (CCA-adding enzyme)
LEVILTHENADFDAVASLLGASKLFPTATPVLPRRVNRNGLAFVSLYGTELPFVQPDDLPRRHKHGARPEGGHHRSPRARR